MTSIEKPESLETEGSGEPGGATLVPRLVDAFRTVPKVNAEQWQQMSIAARWAVATRASVLVMTAWSALLGGLLALGDGRFELLPWTLALLGLVLAHATSNLVNDFVDCSRGLDQGEYHRAKYGTHILLSGLVDRQGMWRYLALTGGTALACGLGLLLLRGGLTAPLMIVGMLMLLGYTWPMKMLGLGEPAVLLVWGLLMVGGSYYIASGVWSWDATLIGLIYGLGPTAVLFAKHLDKFDRDREAGIFTLPIRLGRRNAQRLAAGLMPLAWLCLLLMVLAGRASPWVLLALLSIGPVWKAAKGLLEPAPETRPMNYPSELWPLWYTHLVFLANRRFGMMLVIGLLASVLMRSLA